ncbi:hypothetical protein T10_3337 [Trichinella papuae]|uniref:Uncharacterized protein n=1 Tax=Trichinella papuae TaxID=268474 RepID=A0A0V1MDN6_9BILA|nr:hypothetical protein T10_3337 [Trichinella papuae]
MLATNSSVHEATARLGRELMLSLNVQVCLPPGNGKPVNEFVCNIRQTTDRVREEICHKLGKEQRRQKALFECSVIHQRYMKRDLVSLAKSTKGKIRSSWKGTYKIWKEMGP